MWPLEGVYFDINIKNTTSLLLALHNNPELVANPTARPITATAGIKESLSHRHFQFHAISSDEKPAPPISLLARVDDQEYILLPNASSLVAIRSNDMDPNSEHHVRVIAPMTDDHGRGVVQLAGLWLSKEGKLVKGAGSLLNEEYANEDLLEAENDQIGQKHRSGLTLIEYGSGSLTDHRKARDEDDELLSASQDRKKLLEVVTDSPGSFNEYWRSDRNRGIAELRAGVMGWEYLLGEMFGADHIGIGVDNMCLTQGCIGGTGHPAGMGEVFFRRWAPLKEHHCLFSMD